ncbi:unnamed protein product [Nezara viridula]|uniref:Uncharacterized protein n=1 Tax=Nezara viridula TaxID=85310 RepID=A0A9P0HEA1_NEZVI|nr:unnamed protein product [Nezara viridula]
MTQPPQPAVRNGIYQAPAQKLLEFHMIAKRGVTFTAFGFFQINTTLIGSATEKTRFAPAGAVYIPFRMTQPPQPAGANLISQMVHCQRHL